MEQNIEHLYGLKMKRKVLELMQEFNERQMKEAEEKKEAKRNKDVNKNTPDFNLECNPMEEE